MGEKERQYKSKHKKCKWCQYCQYRDWSELHFVTSYYECILKDKIIKFLKLPRLCKYYTLKEKNK